LFTDDAGALVEERRFEPFGHDLDAYRPGHGTGSVDYQTEPTSVLGKPLDPATGLSFHGARWYEPDTARWLTPDPPTRAPDAKFAVMPWDLHPYVYVRQSPSSYWDPDGRQPAQTESKSYSWAGWWVDHLDPSRGSTPVRILKGIGLTVTAPVVGVLALGQHAAYEVDDYVVTPVKSVVNHVWGWIKPTPIVFFRDPEPIMIVGDIQGNEEIETHAVAYSHEDPIHVAPAPAPKPHHHHHHHAKHHPAAPPTPDLTPGVQPTGPIYIQSEYGGPAASEQSSAPAPCKVRCTMM
jgi:RHS repeat-associated protein